MKQVFHTVLESIAGIFGRLMTMFTPNPAGSSAKDWRSTVILDYTKCVVKYPRAP